MFNLLFHNPEHAEKPLGLPPRPDQRLVHEGVPPSGARKHIIRSDVMFQRRPPVFDDPANTRAFADYERAVQLSEQGDHAAAVDLFVKVSRQAPDLAAELGI